MANELVKVPFHGGVIEAVQDERGVWASVRRMCESLGIEEGKQQQRLAKKAWATTAMMAVVAEDGKVREQRMLHHDSVPMWLATIEANRVKNDRRPMLELYQKEAAKVLADYFLRGEKPSLDMVRLQTDLAQLRVELTRLTDVRHGAREVGTPLGIRERIRREFPGASEKTKQRIVSRVKQSAFHKGVLIWQPLENGPLCVDQVWVWLVDAEIDRARAEVAARDNHPRLKCCEAT